MSTADKAKLDTYLPITLSDLDNKINSLATKDYYEDLTIDNLTSLTASANTMYANKFIGLALTAQQANFLAYQGNHKEAASGTTGSSPSEGMLYSSGLFVTGTYNDSNTPTTYGNIINIAGRGGSQLLLEWKGSDSTTGHLYYRSHRDTSSGGWGDWITILDNSNYQSILNNTYYTESEVDNLISNASTSTNQTLSNQIELVGISLQDLDDKINALSTKDHFTDLDVDTLNV